MKHAEQPQLTVIARAPFNVYYEGPAQAVSAVNRVGEFDILPGHADFFSVLNEGDILIHTGAAEPVKFYANDGIITVRDNEVFLFVNI